MHPPPSGLEFWGLPPRAQPDVLILKNRLLFYPLAGVSAKPAPLPEICFGVPNLALSRCMLHSRP